MGQSHSRVLSNDDKANLEVARQLWEKLKGIPGVSIQDAMIHFLCMVHMGELLALSDREDTSKKPRGVFDVLCCGVTDSATVMGVSSTLRGYLASEAVQRKLCQDVGAFDGAISRLHSAMEAAGQDASQPPKRRPFECCAEHVVYEKLDRLNQTASYTYAVQMVKPKSSNDFSIKAVERCANCKLAGGSSNAPGEGRPFGNTPRLGAVVTDSAAIVNALVPVLTAPVMQVIRDTLRGPDFNDPSREVIRRRFPLLHVWRSPTRQGETRVLAILGPQDELDQMYNHEHVHDEL